MVHSGLPPCPNFHGLTRLPPSLLPLRPDGKGVRVRERERERMLEMMMSRHAASDDHNAQRAEHCALHRAIFPPVRSRLRGSKYVAPYQSLPLQQHM